MEQQNKSFLGTGWAFPVSFDYALSTVNMASEVRDIEQSLTILLNTRPGERVMRPDYGCGLDDLMFGLVTITVVAVGSTLYPATMAARVPPIVAMRGNK